MAKARSDNPTAPLEKLRGCLSQIDGDLSMDSILFDGSPEASGATEATEWCAATSVEFVRKTRHAIDEVSALVRRLSAAAGLKAKVQEWVALADSNLGDALTHAEHALASGNADLAFRYARSSLARLRGTLGEWLTELTKMAGSGKNRRRRWPKGHKPTPEEIRAVESEARRILRNNKKITRDELAHRLGVATGYVSGPNFLAWKSRPRHPNELRPRGRRFPIHIALDRVEVWDEDLEAAKHQSLQDLVREQDAEARFSKCPINDQPWVSDEFDDEID